MSYTDSLLEGVVTEAVDKVAEKQFLDSLKNKFIDIDAFHRAYGSAIEAAGLGDIFGNQKGLLASRGTYGKIKNCQDPELQKGLKKLWVAQYSDNLTTKELQAQRDAEAKARADREAAWKAEQEAKKEALRKEGQLTADKCRAEAIERLVKEHRDVAEKYKELTGREVTEDITLEAEPDLHKNACDYALKIKDRRSYYRFSYDKINDTAYLVKYMILQVQDQMKEIIGARLEAAYAEAGSALSAKSGLSDRDWTNLYFVDKTTNTVYRYGHYADERKNELTVHSTRNGVSVIDRVTIDNIPNIDNLELVAFSNLIDYSHGRCWYSSTTNLFYNPKYDRHTLEQCGVCFEPFEGGFNEPSMSLIPDDKIPDKYKALGFTKGERHDSEYDSSD